MSAARSPVNLSKCLMPLPDDGPVPPLPEWRWPEWRWREWFWREWGWREWRWRHMPGHSVGHVGSWREGPAAGLMLRRTHIAKVYSGGMSIRLAFPLTIT